MPNQLQNFSDLLKILLQNNLYEKAIAEATKKYKIKHYRIDKLKPSIVKNILRKNSKKQKEFSLQQNNYAWAQGQLKIFVWLLVGYLYVKKIDIIDMNQQDFEFFTGFFEEYTGEFLNYQAKFLVKNNEKVIWNENQAKLLNQIIKRKFQQKNWNTVAYELYLLSGRSIFRTPKQCRQRWLNHQDPVKNHSTWTEQQDLQLLRLTLTLGKRWSALSKQMKSTRTEHMVKNRYSSLIKRASKVYKNVSETQLITNILQAAINKDNKMEQESLELQSYMDSNHLANEIQAVELKDLENQKVGQHSKIQNQKLLQDFLPCNLIIDQPQSEQTQGNTIQVKNRIDFFEKDSAYPTSQFLDIFF